MFKIARRGGWLKLAVGLLAVWLAGQTTMARAEIPAVSMDTVARGQLLFRGEAAGRYREAPTLSADVKIAVTGVIARVKVTQAFTNPGEQWLEGIYVFPLHEDAAVDHMRMQVGDRVIEGEIKPRDEAKRTYDQALAEGRKGGLVEQERPNLFTTSVANIGPGETVTITIEYQQSLRLDQGYVQLRFPMAVTPRYIPGMPLSRDESVQPVRGSGWAFDTDRVPDASRITPQVVKPGDAPVNPLRLTVELDAGFPIGKLDSRYHAVTIKRDGDSRATVTLSAQSAERDFEMAWSPRDANVPRAAVFTEAKGGADYALLLLTPPTQAREHRLPRDVVFVIDTSGSMAGESMTQAKQALALAVDRLDAADRFNIIRFSSDTSSLWSDLRTADPEHRSRARRWVNRLDADGGTEMAPALELALNDSAVDAGRVRQVLFLTDGAVGNESELFNIIQKRLGASRLFTVGIGAAPNGHFMTKAAQFGRGTFTYIGNTQEVQMKMTDLFHKLETPVLTSIELHWPDGTQAAVYPKRIPDLYAGEPVVVAAKLQRREGVVELRGMQAGQGFRVSLPLTGGAGAEGLGVLWGRRKIADLMDSLHEGATGDAVRSAVTSVALEHHLVSPYTSLVAVERTSTPADVLLASVPTNLPAGMAYDAVFPQTATPAPLWLLGGLLAALAGWIMRRLPSRRSPA